MSCPHCGNENPEGAKFCFECGAKLAVICPECRASLPPQAKYCLECGVHLEKPLEPELSRELPWAARFQRLVPAEYAERLLAARGQVAPERRTITILFCDVAGSTAMAEHLDPEEVLEITDGAFDRLIEPVSRGEGTRARLMGDAVLAFFGVPIAHEDDPERAIRPVPDIISAARAYAGRLARERGIERFNVRVRINTGWWRATWART
jgi:class 3 adenylate cyclase/ribosomal protein L40E